MGQYSLKNVCGLALKRALPSFAPKKDYVVFGCFSQPFWFILVISVVNFVIAKINGWPENDVRFVSTKLPSLFLINLLRIISNVFDEICFGSVHVRKSTRKKLQVLIIILASILHRKKIGLWWLAFNRNTVLGVENKAVHSEGANSPAHNWCFLVP